MNRMSTKKNKKGSHSHKKQVLVTKIVAMPLFPSFNKGKRLYSKTFDVVEFHSSTERPTKAFWLEAQEKALIACEEFIKNQDSPGRWWLMKRGVKTSFRIATIQMRA